MNFLKKKKIKKHKKIKSQTDRHDELIHESITLVMLKVGIKIPD